MNLKLADQLGWGPQTAKVDLAKLEILDKYIVGKKILDIGAATGKYAYYLEKKGFDVVAIDKDQEFLRYGKSKRRTVADLASLPFKPKSFDTTILFDVLEHVEESLLSNAIRVTKKRLLLTVPRTTDNVLSKRWLVFGHHQDTTHLRTYTKNDVKTLLKKYGLKEVLIKGTHPVVGEALLEILFFHTLKGPLVIRKILHKLVLQLTHPRDYPTNLAVVADIP